MYKRQEHVVNMRHSFFSPTNKSEAWWELMETGSVHSAWWRGEKLVATCFFSLMFSLKFELQNQSLDILLLHVRILMGGNSSFASRTRKRLMTALPTQLLMSHKLESISCISQQMSFYNIENLEYVQNQSSPCSSALCFCFFCFGETGSSVVQAGLKATE